MNLHRKPVALVVDDEPAMVRLARRTLEQQGWRVLEARDGGEAKAVVDATPIDLLVTDIEMPVMTGDQLAAAVRPLRPDLKVLYVSGYVEALFRSAATLPDGQAFLEKPYTPRGLHQAASLLAFGAITSPNEEALITALVG